jgi:hypothetical protein
MKIYRKNCVEKPDRATKKISVKKDLRWCAGIIAKSGLRDLQERPITESNELFRSPHAFADFSSEVVIYRPPVS